MHCVDRRELSNAYLLTNFGSDTAENEPSKICRIPRRLRASSCNCAVPRGARTCRAARLGERARSSRSRQFRKCILENAFFEKTGVPAERCRARFFPGRWRRSGPTPGKCRPSSTRHHYRHLPSEPADDASESVGWQNLGKMLLVFGCIGSDFCKKICVLQHFSKSTRFSS